MRKENEQLLEGPVLVQYTGAHIHVCKPKTQGNILVYNVHTGFSSPSNNLPCPTLLGRPGCGAQTVGLRGHSDSVVYHLKY